MKHLKIILLVLLIGLGHFPAEASEFERLLQMWRAENYEAVIPGLIDFRRGAYGKNVQVDYMLATSCCRIDRLSHMGRKYFQRILLTYELGRDDLLQIRTEQENCMVSHKPFFMAFLDSRSLSGSDVGVSGKTFYWLGRQNAPVGTKLIHVVKDIPLETFKSRCYRPEDRDQAVAAIETLTGPGFKVEAVERFIIATASGQTMAEIHAIGRHLEKVMVFFNREYGMPVSKDMVCVYIVPDTWELKKLAEKIHGLGLADGSIGYSHRSDMSLCAVSSGAHAGTLKHELFHLMVRNNFGDIPPWLDEGMASLYEVSRIESDRVNGLRNWRGDILRRFWQQRPSIDAMVRMSWQAFNAKGHELTRQATNHATARYFILYLQERGALTPLYKAFQALEIEQMPGSPGDEAVRVIETVLQSSIKAIDDDFFSWFDSLDQRLARSNIVSIQQWLNERGYPAGKADGIMGPKTRSALKAFQRDQGLSPTGRPDDETLEILRE